MLEKHCKAQSCRWTTRPGKLWTICFTTQQTCVSPCTTVIALRLFRTNFPIKEGKFAVKLLLRSISASHCFTACINSMFCSTPGHIWSYLVIMACHCSPSALGTHFTPGGFSASALQGHSPKPVSTAGWALPCSVRTCLAQLWQFLSGTAAWRIDCGEDVAGSSMQWVCFVSSSLWVLSWAWTGKWLPNFR